MIRNNQSREMLNILMKKDTAGSQPAGSEASKAIDTGLIVAPFLAWPILDEYGDIDTQPLHHRIDKFLNAIYVVLVMGDKISKQAVRPTLAAAQQAAGIQNIPRVGVSVADVDRYMMQDGRSLLAIKIYKQCKNILQIFLPQEYSSDSMPMQLFWGMVHEICVSQYLSLVIV